MNVLSLKKMLTKSPKDCYRSLSNLYKPKEKNRLCLAVYESQGLSFRETYYLHIEMDYKGKVLAVKDEFRQDIKKINKYKKLIGHKIDLNSFKWDYEKIVHNRPVGVESSYTVGFINNKGNFIVYKKENIDKIIFPKQYRGNQDILNDYGNYEASELFVNFCKKYKKQLQNFQLYNDSIRYYRTGFKIKNFQVSVELQQFFNYSLSLRLYHPQKGCIELKNEEVINFENVLKEFEKGQISSLNKVKMITQVRGVSYCDLEELDSQTIKATIKFDGYDKRPRGKYSFIFDLKKQKVECVDGSKSVKFIPKQVENFQKQLISFKD